MKTPLMIIGVLLGSASFSMSHAQAQNDAALEAALEATREAAGETATESVTVNNVDETGLGLKEVRVKDRLDRIEVRHQKQGLVDYYDVNDHRAQQEGGLSERGLMRTWQFSTK